MIVLLSETDHVMIDQNSILTIESIKKKNFCMFNLIFVFFFFFLLVFHARFIINSSKDHSSLQEP
jgi:hypothetical protein